MSFADDQHGWACRRSGAAPRRRRDPRHDRRRRHLGRQDAERPDRVADQRELRRRHARLDRHDRRPRPEDHRRRRHLARHVNALRHAYRRLRYDGRLRRCHARLGGRHEAAASGRRPTAARPGRAGSFSGLDARLGRHPARLRRPQPRLGARPGRVGRLAWWSTTSDGGRFWRPVPTGDPVRDRHLRRRAPPTSGSLRPGLRCDYYDFLQRLGTVIVQHTSDGGFRWQTSTVAAPALPYAHRGAAAASVCAVGDGILISSDAGATWRSGSSGQQYWFAGGRRGLGDRHVGGRLLGRPAAQHRRGALGRAARARARGERAPRGQLPRAQRRLGRGRQRRVGRRQRDPPHERRRRDLGPAALQPVRASSTASTSSTPRTAGRSATTTPAADLGANLTDGAHDRRRRRPGCRSTSSGNAAL